MLTRTELRRFCCAEWERKRVYLSYPMTVSGPEDYRARDQARDALEDAGLAFYDPELNEPGGRTLAELQDWDYDRMAECTGLLVLWTRSAPKSGGVPAEIEWARRIFCIPAVVYREPVVEMSQWAQVSVRHEIYHAPKAAVARLMEMM